MQAVVVACYNFGRFWSGVNCSLLSWQRVARVYHLDEVASAELAQLSRIDFSWLKVVGVSKTELASSLDRRVAALVCTAGMNQGGVPQSLPFASSGGLSCSLRLA